MASTEFSAEPYFAQRYSYNGNGNGKYNVSTGKPLQVIPWKEKTPEWFKANARYFISQANFNFGKVEEGGRKDIGVFYKAYNGEFSMNLFKHITDPLSAKVAAHRAFPAKIRPVNILRSNIDLLFSEYPRRPFVYNVENLGESGYSSFMDNLNQQLHANLTQHFIQGALMAAQESGQELSEEQLAQLQKDPPLPEQVKVDFHMSYKDALSAKGQRWLKRKIRELGLRKKFHKMFKDWLIAGQAYSYKGVRNERLVYRRVSPFDIDYDKSSENDLIEDGEWVVEKRLLTFSDVVDEFYEELKSREVSDLEGRYQFHSPQAFYSSLLGLYTDGSPESSKGKIPVYHVQWKGQKKVQFISYVDPNTGQFMQEEVDEDFDVKLIPGAKAEIRWPTEVYGTTLIDGTGTVGGTFNGINGLCVGYGAIPVQRSPMTGSGAKLEYNGKKYSDTHASNVSVLELGLPIQILHIIIDYILEKTIAKSKGKIFVFDQNSIPNDGEWDDEKAFYYAEALGYFLLNRNQVGVDKSWNQYQVIDMTLFDSIKQLIELKQSLKQEWDDIWGISRQRKGQTYSSDGQGVNERAVFQSTVITDGIFSGFEEFTESELQGFLDYMKFLTSKGEASMYNDEDFGAMLMEISPGEFTFAELGIFLDNSSEHMDKLKKMENFATAMLQNKAKPSTLMEVIDSVNASELKGKLKRIEEIEQQIAEQQAQSEQEHQAMLEEIAQRHAEYVEVLKRETMEQEYDRKEDIEYIRGSFNTFTFQNGDANANAIPDTVEVMKMNQDREKLMQEWTQQKMDRAEKTAQLALQKEQLAHTMEMDRAKLKQGDKKLKIDAKKAKAKPRPSR